jgi:hypothetical protein
VALGRGEVVGSPEFRRSGGCGRPGTGGGRPGGHLDPIPALSRGGGGHCGWDTPARRGNAGQGVAARAPTGPRGGVGVVG